MNNVNVFLGYLLTIFNKNSAIIVNKSQLLNNYKLIILIFLIKKNNIKL